MKSVKFLTDVQVAERYQISRATIWRWLYKGKFVKPFKIPNGVTRWDIDDLIKWEKQQKSPQ